MSLTSKRGRGVLPRKSLFAERIAPDNRVQQEQGEQGEMPQNMLELRHQRARAMELKQALVTFRLFPGSISHPLSSEMYRKRSP